jgi:hypothetical protein
MFLNAVRPGAVGFAVDVNPRKWGSRVPGTAQEVVAPEDLRARVRPDRIILSNAVYEREVRADLADLGVTAPVSAL